MRFVNSIACITVLIATATASAAVRMEIASQAGPNANAQRDWLQLLAELGVTGVRIRGANPGDKPHVEELGTPERPMPRVLGVLTRNGVLVLPEGRFKKRDRAKLADYLARLQADGATAVTVQRGSFGLTLEQFEAVFVALGEPIGSIDANDSLRNLTQRCAAKTKLPLYVEPRAKAALLAKPGITNIEELSHGTALAILLRAEGLTLRPEKPNGKPVRLTVAPAFGKATETWPLGYKPERSPSETAPVLMQRIPVEISGFTLTEALNAIEPRLGGLPIVYDTFALRQHAIDPSAVQVKLARTETFYKRIVDRLAFQARLKTQLRVDEAGKPFLWLTR